MPATGPSVVACMHDSMVTATVMAKMAVMAAMVNRCVPARVAVQRPAIVMVPTVIPKVRVAQIGRAIVQRNRVAARQYPRPESLVAIAAALQVAQHALAHASGALLLEILGRQHERGTTLLDVGNDCRITLPLRAHRRHLINPQWHCRSRLRDSAPTRCHS